MQGKCTLNNFLIIFFTIADSATRGGRCWELGWGWDSVRSESLFGVVTFWRDLLWDFTFWRHSTSQPRPIDIAARTITVASPTIAAQH